MKSVIAKHCALLQIAALVLLCPIAVKAQTLSDKGLKPYVDLWNNEEVDSLKTLLPALIKKFPSQPETQFFKAVFDSDGDRAYEAYGAIVNQSPKNIFAQESLFRRIQYDVAKGRYQLAQDKLTQLKQNYSDSKFIKSAEAFFTGLKNDSVKVITAVKEEPVTAAVPETIKKYRLQVGAFSTQKNADELKEKLVQKGYKPIELSEKTVNDKKLILVWVGTYNTKEEAQKAGEMVKQKENLSFSVVEK